MPKAAARKTEENFSYDDLPYASFSYAHTHPQHLSMIGTLFGMEPADFKTARVLELGCAAGGNILPLASMYPEARFVGIDLSKAQIDEANKDAKALHLKNITFEQMDINDFPAKAGEFDYIICHGILSWVPAGVQDTIFALFQKHLAPKGLAMVSYNTLPGWHFVRALREMMIFHSNRFASSKDKITQALAFLDFVHDNTPASNTAYKQIIDNERQNLKKTNDSYIFHDHLEENNTPFYLHEVIKKAADNGLHYVGDTAVATMFVGNLPPAASEKLGALNNVVLQEQYMDFLNNRRFRNSVFARADNQINRSIKGHVVLDLTARATFRAQEETPDISKTVTFTRKDPAAHFASSDRAASALLLAMTKTFKPLPVRELIRRAAEEYGVAQKDLEDAAQKNLIRLFLSGLVNLHAGPPKSAETMPVKPKVYNYGRHLAAKEGGVPYMTNMMGDSIKIDQHGLEVVRLADGSRTVPEIAEDFVQYLDQSGGELMKNSKPVAASEKEAAVNELVNSILTKLMRGLTIAE